MGQYWCIKCRRYVNPRQGTFQHPAENREWNCYICPNCWGLVLYTDEANKS